MTTWDIAHGNNSSQVNVTYHKRPRLGATVNVGYAALITGKFSTNWHPGLPLPPVVSSNWFPNLGHLPQFDTGLSQGAISSVSTNPSNPFTYTKISRIRHLAAWVSNHAPCGTDGEVGTIYYVFRRGRVKDMRTFPGAATFLRLGTSNEVVAPFPINDYWFAMTAKVCTGCDPCWEPSWGDPNSIVLGTSTWNLPGFSTSSSTTASGRSSGTSRSAAGSSGVSVSQTGPVALVLNTRSGGGVSSTLEIPAPISGTLAIEKSTNLTVWEQLTMRATSDGYILADDDKAGNAGIYRLIALDAAFEAPRTIAAADPNQIEATEKYECLKPFSHELRPVPIVQEDLNRFLEFERVFHLQSQ